MILFFTDLDNTAIYSHRRALPEPRVCVEILREKPQSFMTEKTYTYYRNQSWLKVVPVTTRTYDQYRRLRGMSKELNWHTALICNGAVLLHDLKEDAAWTAESLAISEPDRPAYREVLEKACAIVPPESVVSADPFLFYVKTDEAERVYEDLCRSADLSHVSIFRDSRKVYGIPRSLGKESAVRRLMRREGKTFCMAAGDSEFDLGMLSVADICFCPESLEGKIKTGGRTFACKGVFSDEICDNLEILRREGKTVD